jgi:hypothetical protein
MATTIDPARLYAILMNTGLQNKDQPLYQMIHDLIATLVSVNKQVTTLLTSISPSSTPSSSNGSKITQFLSPLDGDGSDDFFGGMIIPGNVGAIGLQGLQGIQGEDGINGEDSYIPGPQGAAGVQGIQGLQGVPGLDGDSFDNYPIDFPLPQSPLFTGVITQESDGLAVTLKDGLIIQNTTASTAGVPIQVSPSLRLSGTVWNTTSVASQVDRWELTVIPISAATPTSGLLLQSITGGQSFTFGSTGSIQAPGGATIGGNLNIGSNVIIPSGTALRWANGAGTRVLSSTDGQLLWTNSAASSGISFNFTTDSLLQIRTRAATGDASISALNISTSGTEIDTSFIIAVPVTLGTVVMGAGTQRLIINPAGTLAVLTVTLPASPVNGQLAKVSFTQAITSLTFNAPAGVTVISSPTSAAIDSIFRFIYQSSSTSWFPAG